MNKIENEGNETLIVLKHFLNLVTILIFSLEQPK